MRQFFVLYRKDFCTNFSVFNALAIFGVYYILSLFFAIYFGDYFLRESEVMNAYFVLQPLILTLVIPAVTMRSWAEEIKSGTIELLLTQPVSYLKLVLAKFFAAYCFFLVLVLSSVLFWAVSAKLSVLDNGTVFSGYAGLLLCGAFFCAVGCTISSACKNNILSYICTIFALFFITQTEFTSFHLGKVFILLEGLSFSENYNAFLSGVISYGNVFYFISASILLLWLNVVIIGCKRIATKKEKHLFYIFLSMLFMLFVSSSLGASLIFSKHFDITDEKKYTLTKETEDFLAQTDKRIDIILYEAKSKREEANSSYAVYAEFVERFLKLIEQKSNRAIRTNTILVDSFSPLERRLIRDGVSYETDKFDKKSFLAAEFSDNDGNRAFINSFSNLRQNLLEADIMRLIRQFGLEKKEIAVIASHDDWNNMSSFDKLLQEFYKITQLDFNTPFIAPLYDAVIVINPTQLSSEFLLAAEQYVLSGGRLVIFSEPSLIGEKTGKPLLQFLDNFGIKPIALKRLSTRIGDTVLELGAAKAVDTHTNRNIRSVLVNGAGIVKYASGDEFKTWPVLEFEGEAIAVASAGKYTSNYLDLAAETIEIKPVSEKDGIILFFYDSDMLKDYLYVSAESKGDGFYETVPLSDNMLFFLRLLDYVCGNNSEHFLTYRHYAINSSSIGNAVLTNVKKRYEAQTTSLEEEINTLKAKKENVYNRLESQGFLSVKNIGNISDISQALEDAEDNLNKLKSQIGKEYQAIIVSITLILIFACPLFMGLIAALIIYVHEKRKRLKIRRLS